MPPFEWSAKYSVKIAILDEQHKKLVDLINELNDLLTRGEKTDKMGEVLDRLLDYTAYHFMEEERLLEKYEYPDLLRHKNDHDFFSWRVLELRGRRANGEQLEEREILDFLVDWLKDHILNSDRRYVDFLNSKGVS